jgi:potassium channel LctB
MVDWKVHGPIFWALERGFILLQRLSGSVRPDLGVRYSRDLQKWKVICNDGYIILFLVAEVAACVYVAQNWRPAQPPVTFRAAAVIWVLAGLRIVDILQAGVNTVLFDGLRQAHRGPQTILSFHRKLLLESVNYVELVVLFGLIYSALDGRFDGKLNDWTDAFYFSGVTQLTIGYGEITPTRVGKFLALAQGLIAFFFSILVLARVVSVLPRMHDVGVDGSIPAPPTGSSAG